MEDERNVPQDEDEVEAHRLAERPVPEPGHVAREDDDEVEAHRMPPAPERPINRPIN